MILSGQTIRKLCSTWPPMIQPFEERTEVEVDGKKFTYGLGPAGLDVRVEFDAIGAVGSLNIPRDGFALASTIERFEMPNDVMGVVHDKSSLARKGLAVQNTVIEPGWRGFLTMEVSNHSAKYWFDPLLRLFGFRCGIVLSKGDAIAQVLFHFTDKPVEQGYAGKYQDQPRGPQIPLKEDGTPL